MLITFVFFFRDRVVGVSSFIIAAGKYSVINVRVLGRERFWTRKCFLTLVIYSALSSILQASCNSKQAES